MIILIDPSIEYINVPEMEFVYSIICNAASNCYQSEPKNSERLVKKIVDNGHHSVLEHIKVTFAFICDRAVSHEVVRHRIGVSYSQESQRYVGYRKDLSIVKPYWFDQSSDNVQKEFLNACLFAHDHYKKMIYNGLPPEAARGILPNATATKIIISMNLRALMHFIKIRGSNRAHPDIRWFSNRLKEYFSCKYPVIFNQ